MGPPARGPSDGALPERLTQPNPVSSRLGSVRLALAGQRAHSPRCAAQRSAAAAQPSCGSRWACWRWRWRRRQHAHRTSTSLVRNDTAARALLSRFWLLPRSERLKAPPLVPPKKTSTGKVQEIAVHNHRDHEHQFNLRLRNGQLWRLLFPVDIHLAGRVRAEVAGVGSVRGNRRTRLWQQPHPWLPRAATKSKAALRMLYLRQ